MIDVKSILQKNSQRVELINKTYNPITGEGCQGERVHLIIQDAPSANLYLPKEMMSTDICKQLKKQGSISEFLLKVGLGNDQKSIDEFWIAFCEIRYKFDFEFFAITCDNIQDKLTGNAIAFKLNRGQRRLISRLEKMRLNGEPIRVILLKARQWGGSTCIQLYMQWIQTVHKQNWNSVICAHVKDAAINIRAMFSFVTDRMIPINGKRYKLKPFENTQNIKILSDRNCKITVGTAEEPESVRSQDAKMAHFSEVGLYPNTEKNKTDR